MKIQILGSGCRKCKELFANAEKAIKSGGIECGIEKVTDIEKIVDMGVMTTPALAIDGKVVSSGKVLTVEEILRLLVKESSGHSGSSCGCQNQPAETPCGCGERNKGGFFRKIITVILLLFVAGSVLYIMERENKPAVTKKTEALPADVLKVYYFHGTMRCMTCNAIETLTRNAVGKSENAMFISVNAEEPQNEHFIKDFNLVNRAVVMERNGKFEKFDRVWELAGTPDEFTAYIKSGMEKLSK